MSAVNNLFERAVMGLVTRVSGRTVVVLAVVLYPGAGLILPIALHWSTLQLVETNVLGTSLAGVLSLGWLSAQVEAGKRRHLVEWTSDLRLLSAEEFEWLVAETFRREGWKVRLTGHQDAPDGNIDLELSRDSQRKIVQCKRWQSWNVGVDEVRQFAGTILGEGLQGSDGIYVTLSDFTQPARMDAKRTGVTLIDGRDLYSKVENARRPELCINCHRPMRLGRSQLGWWFRCITPGCSGKRDLGNEPGRAVELLTKPPALAPI